MDKIREHPLMKPLDLPPVDAGFDAMEAWLALSSGVVASQIIAQSGAHMTGLKRMPEHGFNRTPIGLPKKIENMRTKYVSCGS